jgi:dTDP-4-amino-4,6-dideoxygalactose transaminase
VPPELDAGHVYHLFPVRVPAGRAAFMAHLEQHGVGSLIHYPVPIPRQEAFAGMGSSACAVTDRVCEEVCSLPLYPQMSDGDVGAVVEVVHAWSGPPRHT